MNSSTQAVSERYVEVRAVPCAAFLRSPARGSAWPSCRANGLPTECRPTDCARSSGHTKVLSWCPLRTSAGEGVLCLMKGHSWKPVSRHSPAAMSPVGCWLCKCVACGNSSVGSKGSGYRVPAGVLNFRSAVLGLSHDVIAADVVALAVTPFICGSSKTKKAEKEECHETSVA